jgi:hypothetical protein
MLQEVVVKSNGERSQTGCGGFRMGRNSAFRRCGRHRLRCVSALDRHVCRSDSLAIVTNGGLGGPLAYPAGLFVIVLVAAAAAIALFFPATAAAELIGRRWKVPFLAQIPVTVGVLAVLCLPAAIGVERFWSQAPSPRSVATLAVWLFGLSLLPVGFYWWVAQSGTLLFKAVRALQRGRLLKNRL